MSASPMAETRSTVSMTCGTTRTQRRLSLCGAPIIHAPRRTNSARLAPALATWIAFSSSYESAKSIRSIGFHVVAALFPQHRSHTVPVHFLFAACVAKRFVDALLHALQAADVDVAVCIAEQPRNVRAPLANPVLYVALRLAGNARECKVDVDEILRQLQERAEVRELSCDSGTEEQHELAAFLEG